MVEHPAMHPDWLVGMRLLYSRLNLFVITLSNTFAMQLSSDIGLYPLFGSAAFGIGITVARFRNGGKPLFTQKLNASHISLSICLS